MFSQIRYLSTLQFHAFFTLPRSTPAATHHPFAVNRRRLSPPPSTVPLLVFSSDFELNRTVLTTGKERNEQLRRDRRFCNTKLFNWKAMAMTVEVLAGLAFMFSSSILLQILACAIYSNWWPLLSALMYVLVPMPCMFFGGGSTQFLLSRDGGGWIDAAKFLTGASAVGSFAIPAILRHANMIETGAMVIDFTAFFIFGCTVLCFHRASRDDEW